MDFLIVFLVVLGGFRELRIRAVSLDQALQVAGFIVGRSVFSAGAKDAHPFVSQPADGSVIGFALRQLGLEKATGPIAMQGGGFGVFDPSLVQELRLMVSQM